MSRTREGDNFSKIETWLPSPQYPETQTISNVDVFVDTATNDQTWRIVYRSDNSPWVDSTLQKSEAELFMNSLEECFGKALSQWDEEHNETRESSDLRSDPRSNAAIMSTLDIGRAMVEEIIESDSEIG